MDLGHYELMLSSLKSGIGTSLELQGGLWFRRKPILTVVLIHSYLPLKSLGTVTPATKTVNALFLVVWVHWVWYRDFKIIRKWCWGTRLFSFTGVLCLLGSLSSMKDINLCSYAMQTESKSVKILAKILWRLWISAGKICLSQMRHYVS